jgi:exonuclease III
MSIISLNCRGVGKNPTVRDLRTMARRFAPTVLCLLETQVQKRRAENLTCTLGFDHTLV